MKKISGLLFLLVAIVFVGAGCDNAQPEKDPGVVETSVQIKQ